MMLIVVSGYILTSTVSPRRWPCELDEVEGAEDRVVERGREAPNYVHFLRLGPAAPRPGVVETACLLAAVRVQRPLKVFVHTDLPAEQFDSFRWRYLLATPGWAGIVQVRTRPVPEHVFGLPLSAAYRTQHVRDITRLRVLKEYGGIFLENDSLLQRNLSWALLHEAVMSGDGDGRLLVARPGAALVNRWLRSYVRYRGATRAGVDFRPRPGEFHPLEAGEVAVVPEEVEHDPLWSWSKASVVHNMSAFERVKGSHPLLNALQTIFTPPTEQT